MAENNPTLLVLGVVLVVLMTAGLTYYITKAGGEAPPPVQNGTNVTGETPTIMVRGEATKTLSPDLLTIGITIETLGANTSDAQSKNAQEVAKVKAALLAAGVNASDIQTNSYYTYPEYNETCRKNCHYPYYDYQYGGEAVPAEDAVYEKGVGTSAPAERCIGANGEAMTGPNGEVYRCGASASLDGAEAGVAYADVAPSYPYPYPCENNCSIIGYKTTHVLSVATGKTTEGGKMVESALNATNSSKIDYIYFSIKEETRVKVESELQASAAVAAKSKADNIAKGLGAKLGKIVSINPDYYYPYPIYAYDRAESSGGTSSAPAMPPTEIFPTDTTMSSSITVVYEIVQ
ncbi:SIMPL domain-containing protein [Candidatus Micrarchaeota archaeon]|nr:SIMPL domain-containing protein [Candidatus Micrarchaeota archaeon]